MRGHDFHKMAVPQDQSTNELSFHVSTHTCVGQTHLLFSREEPTSAGLGGLQLSNSPATGCPTSAPTQMPRKCALLLNSTDRTA